MSVADGADAGVVLRGNEGVVMMGTGTAGVLWCTRGLLRRAAWLVAGVVVVALIGGAVGTSPAFAGWGSPVAVGRGSLNWPVGVGVDQSSGIVYVGNLTGSRLDDFDLTHELIAPPSPFGEEPSFYAGTAVNPTNHELYALNARAKEVQTYEPANGTLVEHFAVPGAGNIRGGVFAVTEIASDAAGNVYVPEPESNQVGGFNEKGEAPGGGVAGTIVGSGEHALSKPTGVAVDANGNIWIADTGNNRLEEFEANGGFVKEIPSEGVHAVAVDVSGDVFASVFASSGPQVVEYNATGEQTEAFGGGVIGEETIEGEPLINGIALDEAHHIVYVTSGGNGNPGARAVWAFTKAPATSTQAATGITSTEATLNGTVNPGDEPVTGCEFEYGTSAAYGHSSSCEQTEAQIGTGIEPVAVSARVAGLEVDQTYHFRLHTENAFDSGFGGDLKFTAIEPVFGFQLGGPNALGITVSEGEMMENGWMVANPEKLDTQAGSHPLAVTTRFEVNTEPNGNFPSNLEAKDYYVNIPAGFAGSVAKIPRCRMSELSSLGNRHKPPGCPTASQVGVIRIFQSAESGPFESSLLPVYNMVPPPGVPAELAFPLSTIAEPVVFQLRSDGDYGITAKVRNIVGILPIIGSQLTLWGVPADPEHDMERFLPENGTANKVFEIQEPGDGKGGPLPAGAPEVPFLTNPTRCGAQNDATITADPWVHPGKLAEDGLPVPSGEGWVTASTPMFPNGISGCEKLTFRPELEVKPDTTVADSPTGLTVDLRVPQSEGANNYATPALKKAVVTLPQGVSISPSQANGLEGCTPAQVKLHSMAQPECPNASQVGTLELTTPLLPEPLSGRIYLSSERSGSTFHLYLVVEGQGVLIKLEGSVEANEQTGQIVSTFDRNPQLPFSDLELTFFGGKEAALATPNACGSYATTSFFEPWSHDPAPGEVRGTPNAEPAVEPFTIGSGCVSGFAPGFKAGAENPVAGAFSPFTLTVSRGDGEQELEKLQVKLPKGLVGKLAGVAKCSDAQIAQAERNTGAAEKASPSCPSASLLGGVQAGAGPGEAPFFLPGKAYLTGPYNGAPYGMAVIVPVLAGPFDLGTVVVRSAIYIDSHTAQVTVKSDPLPRMLDGIPLRMRRIEVSVNRPKFTLNPTSCEPTKVTGLLSSFEGAQHATSARFQVGDCASLTFKPGFKVSTKARHTKRFGAFLRVKVTSGPEQANIRSVFVKLPKALPSRAATLKGACSERQFAVNPAGCPAASKVGSAIARTPILSTPLTGPAIFVSHGGAAFPDLDIVLQGSGITIVLEGNTNIRHNVTSSDFKSVPDVPVSSFELTLPTGLHSALSANGNLCKQKLRMPTVITGQNGAVLERSTKVAVKGCKAARKVRKARGRRHRRRRG